MTAYATADQVINRYKPLQTMIGTGSTDVSTTDIASVFIADAESFMNAYLASKYVVPVQVEPLITQLCSDIAIYKILEDKCPRIPDFMEKRYMNACSMLAMLVGGVLQLTGSNQIVSSGGDQEVWSTVLEQAGPVFKPTEQFSHYFAQDSVECW